ncbi:MAG: hypothetical protein GXX99_02530 [Clostridiales bacterium]|nr:hypothetical protein [Clostridiales bacterium]
MRQLILLAVAAALLFYSYVTYAKTYTLAEILERRGHLDAGSVVVAYDDEGRQLLEEELPGGQGHRALFAQIRLRRMLIPVHGTAPEAPRWTIAIAGGTGGLGGHRIWIETDRKNAYFEFSFRRGTYVAGPLENSALGTLFGG